MSLSTHGVSTGVWGHSLRGGWTHPVLPELTVYGGGQTVKLAMPILRHEGDGSY